MAKFHGTIGYAFNTKTSPGIYTEEIVEKECTGDWNKHRVRVKTSDSVNDGFTLVNTLSMLANPFAIANLFNIRYVVYKGIKWKVSDVEEQFPRIILTIGDRYNE